MNPENFINMDNNNMDKNKYAQFIQRRLQSLQSRNHDWKMSYSFVKTAQKNIVLQHKSNILLYSYKSKLKDACPVQIQALKQHIQKDLEPKYDEPKSIDIDFDEEEKEEDLDVHPSELTVELPKLKTWDMYKQLVEESSRLRPKIKCIPEQPVIDVSKLSKFYFKYQYIHQIFT
ncbi:uncharacterized protein LOC122716912, partial [Apis laboriosa]|uniref:uncharacterized protein LOC122716912 n=1 Tax=Apis laboriosa TaxID=183418 RepID=UPI001CC59F0C